MGLRDRPATLIAQPQLHPLPEGLCVDRNTSHRAAEHGSLRLPSRARSPPEAHPFLRVGRLENFIPSIPASPRPIRYSHCTTPTPLILWTSWVENFIPNKHRSPRLTSHARFTSHANLPHAEGSSTRRLHTEREWVIRTQPATPTARAQPANLPDPQRRLT